jgi:hypothetical protein
MRHVIGIAVVVVAGYVSRAAVDDFAGRVAEGVPDGRALAVGAGAAFDLEGAGGHAPDEVGRKLLDFAHYTYRRLRFENDFIIVRALNSKRPAVSITDVREGGRLRAQPPVERT